MTPHVHDPAHGPRIPGVPFDAPVCICRECERLLTASDSVLRGTGPTCHAKEQRARYVDPCQLALPWEQEARG